MQSSLIETLFTLLQIRIPGTAVNNTSAQKPEICKSWTANTIFII